MQSSSPGAAFAVQIHHTIQMIKNKLIHKQIERFQRIKGKELVPKGNRSINSGRPRLLLRTATPEKGTRRITCLSFSAWCEGGAQAVQRNLPNLWIYSAALIPETVTPVRLLLCSRGLCTHGGSLFTSKPQSLFTC